MDFDWLTEVDHTGDAGIVVTAPDLPTLFERAAVGMFAIVTDVARVSSGEAREVVAEGSDLPDLLLRWLSELNFIHLTESMVFGSFEIHELTDGAVRATARGERIDPGKHRIHTEVKAVTYHGLRVDRCDGAWEAQVIFDM